MTGPLGGILIVMAAFVALFAVIRLIGARANLHPEISRKAFHIGMGLVCTSLPWLFHDVWPVLLLGVLAGVALIGLRVLPILRTSIGSVLHRVERLSLGEFYFITGVTLLYVLSGRNTMLYVIPMLWLTFADATAALIGVRYGTVRFRTHDGRKSIEGSLAFAVVTFMTTFVALVAWGRVDALGDALIAAIAAALATLLEAVVWDGFDNFAIPVFGYVLLSTLASLDALGLAVRFGVLALLVALTIWLRRRTSLLDEALLAAVLIGYALWVFGGWAWLIAPATLLLKDKYDSRSGDDERRHDVHAIVATCAVGLALAVVRVQFPHIDVFYAYTLSFAVAFALFDLTLRLARSQGRSPGIAIAVSTLYSTLVLFVPYLLMNVQHPLAIVQAAFALPIVLACCLAFYFAQPGIVECPRDSLRWTRQTTLTAIGTAVGFFIVFAL